MQHLTLGIENHHDGETETYGIAQSVHGLQHVLVIRLAAVVDVDINVVAVHQGLYLLVSLDEGGKPKAPYAPVATHLAYHVLALCLGYGQCRVYQFYSAAFLVIDTLAPAPWRIVPWQPLLLQ